MRLQRVAQVLNEVLRLLVSALFLEADNQIGGAAAVVWKKRIDCLINLFGFLPLILVKIGLSKAEQDVEKLLLACCFECCSALARLLLRSRRARCLLMQRLLG